MVKEQAFGRWFDSLPAAAIYTCSRCGTTGTKWELNSQYPRPEWYCIECVNAIGRERRSRRKEQLARMPKCEACGKHRGTWRVSRGAGEALLCGWCKRKAQSALYRSQGATPWLPWDMSKSDILRLARGGT